VTDDDIQRILHRAAELQGLVSASASVTPVAELSDRQRLGFVAEAAEEVGISKSDFALATAEVVGSPSQKVVSAKKLAQSQRWLNNNERVFRFESKIAASGVEVLGSLQAVLTGSDYQVQVSNMVGEDPLVDGVLVLEPADLLQLSLGQGSKFRYAMATADFRQVLITVRPDPAAPGQTVLSFHVALDHAAVVSFQWYLGLTVVPATLVALATALLPLSAGPVLGVSLVLVAFGGAYLGIKTGWRALYRWGLETGKKALRELAGRVERALRLKGL
jgi:hypothetical protein